MKKPILYAVLIGTLSLLFSGCATSHWVRVDALSEQPGRTGSGQTYQLASAMEGVKESDLFFKELARFLKPVMANQRFYPVEEGQQADLLIEVDAHISEPMTETESYTEPVYYETGGYYRTVRVPVVDKDGKVVRFAYNSYWRPSRISVGGWVDNNRQVTVYDKILRLSAKEILNDGTYSDEVWAITISLRDESTDYRASLVYMLVAANDYIGKRTEGEEVVIVSEDAEEVSAFRGSVSDAR